MQNTFLNSKLEGGDDCPKESRDGSEVTFIPFWYNPILEEAATNGEGHREIVSDNPKPLLYVIPDVFR